MISRSLLISSKMKKRLASRKSGGGGGGGSSSLKTGIPTRRKTPFVTQNESRDIVSHDIRKVVYLQGRLCIY